MEEDVRRKGKLHLYQQRFGKKWKKVWAEAIAETSQSVARLELYEFSKSSMKEGRKRGENKQVIILRKNVQITVREGDLCKRECRAFTVQTADKVYTFSCPQEELQGWITELCNLTNPNQFNSRSGSLKGEDHTLVMKENSLYESTVSVRDFPVVVVRTEAAIRSDLKGEYFLTPQSDRLLLKKHKTSPVVFSWPYRFVRKFGQDMLCFNFEAGRRCESGEGYFEFATSHGDQIFNIINSAIANLPHGEGSASGTRAMERSVSHDPCSMYTQPEPKKHSDKKTVTGRSQSSISATTESSAHAKGITSSPSSKPDDLVYSMITKPKAKLRAAKKQQLPDFSYYTDDIVDEETQLDESMARLSLPPVCEAEFLYSEVKQTGSCMGKEVLVDNLQDFDYFPPPPPFEPDSDFTFFEAREFDNDRHLHDIFSSSEQLLGTNEKRMEIIPAHLVSDDNDADPVYAEVKDNAFLRGNQNSVDCVDDFDFSYGSARVSKRGDCQAGQFATYDNFTNQANRL